MTDNHRPAPLNPVPLDDVPAQLHADSMSDLVTLVPYLLGFRPSDSVVALGITGGAAGFVARADLPPPGALALPIAEQVAQVVARQDVDGALICGYGPPARADPAVAALIAALTLRLVPVYDALRVEDHRYWSYLCGDARCCPPHGRLWDPAGPAALAAIAAGRVALPDRAALEACLAPVTGEVRAAADEAREAARGWLVSLVRQGKAGYEALHAEAVRLVSAALTEGRAAPLSDELLARLAVALSFGVVRDAVWQEFHAADPDDQVRLWTEVVRRADARTTSGAATLLAYAAWARGDGTLAGIAVRRALAVEPGDPLAHDIAAALAAGLPPGTWPIADQRAPLSSATDWRGLTAS